jgi:N-acetylated-alpha-linked acidic dipeptidase
LTTGVEIGSDQKFKTGDGSVKVKLKITNENRATHPIWNVVGSIQGREQQEMGVIIGAARDSSCYGTLGTNTGTVALLELVKIFTTLQREYNWIPTRSIYFASWDATENNLSGSSEWIENKREALKNEGYAYIDMSDLVSGDKLSIKSHPLLKSVIKDALRSVKQVGNDKSLYDLYKDQHHGSDDITNNMLEEKNYLPFINVINMPSMEVKFTGTKYPKGTCLDTFEFFENTKIDSDMTKHKQIVELLGLIVLNLAEAPLIPYSFPELSTSLDRFTKDLEKYTRHIIDSLESNKLPNIKFDSLHRALEMLRSAGLTYEEFVNSWRQYIAETEDLEPTLLSMKRWKWNDDLVSFNQRFLFKDSSPTRPGFLNMLIGLPFMAPNVEDDEWQWNSFPTIRDSLYTRDFGKVQSDLNQVATLISMAAQRLFDPYG